MKNIITPYGKDDHIQIQEALDGRPEGVVLSSGIFRCAAPLDFGDFASLRGQGKSTILMAEDGLDSDLLILKSPSVEQVILRDFAIDGNRANQSAGKGIFFDNTDIEARNLYDRKDAGHLIEGVFVWDCKEDGIHLFDSLGTYLSNTYIFRCDGNGYVIDGSDIMLVNANAGNCGLRGFELTKESSSSQLTNCKAYYSGRIDVSKGQGFRLSGNYLQLANCQAQDNYSHGFQLSGIGLVLGICVADSNGRPGARANGFQWYSGDKRSLLNGCVAFDRFSGGDRRQNNGFRIESGADYIQITGFTHNNYTAGISNASAGEHIDLSGIKEWG